MSNKGTHDYVDDPRNKDILININGELFARDEAKVSVFDSGYILGDGVWEGLRAQNGVWAPHWYASVEASTGTLSRG
ncbi:MAG: hypothetical protein V2I33_14215 [Kangiellaceae bacterium]|jgi:branched-chain amino acid aminotransferase|nr:hypothetical protein [Kangiellaceae bacterium]